MRRDEPYPLSKVSQKRLATCHFFLQDVTLELLYYMDVSVLCGHRGADEQNKALLGGFSDLAFPLSTHNKFPSIGIDLGPWKDGSIRFKDIDSYCMMYGLIKGIAEKLRRKNPLYKNYHIGWGGGWKRRDYGHFEMVEVK